MEASNSEIIITQNFVHCDTANYLCIIHLFRLTKQKGLTTMSSNGHTHVNVILEGTDQKNLRFVVLYRDFHEACEFCKSALEQLQHRSQTFLENNNKKLLQYKIESYQRPIGRVVQLLCENNGKIVAQYVVQRANIL